MNTQTVVVLRVDNKSGVIQTKTYSSVFIHGLRIPSRFSPCKTQNVMKGADLHPNDHSIQLFTDTSNKGWGAHLEQASIQRVCGQQWSNERRRMRRKITLLWYTQDGDSVNTRCLFFLDVGQMPLASRESIQFHMVSYV